MISLFFLSFLLLTVLWNRYYAAHWNRSLAVTLNLLQDFVYAGEQAKMTEQIENRKRLALPVLEVSFHVDKRLAFHDCENTNVSDFTYKRDIFALLGYQRVTRQLTLDCTHRGYYRIDQSYLASFSLLHHRRYSVDVPADAQLYVYAARTNVTDILLTFERLMGSVQCSKRLLEDPFAYASIREYTITDPMKTINWKASARTGDLMVNTFESTHTEKVLLILDVEDSGILKYEYLTEEAVCVAASLAQKMILRGMDVGLCTNIADASGANAGCTTYTYLAPANGKKHLTDIERLLARHRLGTKVLPLPTILDTFAGQSMDQTKDAVVIFISKNAVLNHTAIETFIGRQRQAVWVVPNPHNEPCLIRTSDNIRLILREVNDV